MTLVGLLDGIKEFLEDALQDMMLIVPPDDDEEENIIKKRTFDVYRQRHPKRSDDLLVPYIQLVLLTGSDEKNKDNKAEVRMGVVLYDQDPEEGALTLLSVVERIRMGLHRQGQVGNQYRLNSFEFLMHDEETENYHVAEISTVWETPEEKQDIPFLRP